jgi:hypothetical protein
MTRYRVMVAVLTLLALPLGAGTEQTVIRPEANWTTTAPPRGTLTAGALGPRIVMQSPQLHETRVERTIETVTPLDLLILFEANRAPVDMDSLQVTARKWLFTKSLTALLRPYIWGTTLQGLEVKIPEGRFLLEIEIADVDGAKTVETYRVKVRWQ